MKLDAQTIIISALFIFGAMCFFVPVPQNNMDLLKTIVTAFVAFVTGAAVGLSINKKEDASEKTSNSVNVP